MGHQDPTHSSHVEMLFMWAEIGHQFYAFMFLVDMKSMRAELILLLSEEDPVSTHYQLGY